MGVQIRKKLSEKGTVPKFLNTNNCRTASDWIWNDTTPVLRGQARIVLRYSLIRATTLFDRASTHLVLRYSLISATTLSDHASAHFVLRYSLISVTTLSVSASALLLCATTP